MNCHFFHGKLSQEDREFLMQLLTQYDAGLILKSWVQLGQVKIPGGKRLDPEKVRAAEILKHEGFCGKERVHVYALDVSCVFHTEKG
jgi:hypothetical protein